MRRLAFDASADPTRLMLRRGCWLLLSSMSMSMSMPRRSS